MNGREGRGGGKTGGVEVNSGTRGVGFEVSGVGFEVMGFVGRGVGFEATVMRTVGAGIWTGVDD